MMQQDCTEHGFSCHHNHHGDDSACVSIVPIFNHLDKDQLLEIGGVTQSVLYKKGEYIYHAGDKSDSLYIVGEGKIKIFRISESGKEQLIRILMPGDFTGELALFNESIHEAYAQAMVNTRVCTVNRSNLQMLLLKYPSISLKVLSEFSNRLGQSEKQAASFATENVETRIAQFLLDELDRSNHPTEVTLPMSKKDLASYLGTTPETISRKIFELEDAGLIKQKTQRKIEILDMDGLMSL